MPSQAAQLALVQGRLDILIERLQNAIELYCEDTQNMNLLACLPETSYPAGIDAAKVRLLALCQGNYRTSSRPRAGDAIHHAHFSCNSTRVAHC